MDKTNNVTRSYRDIILSNIFTLFNLINIILALLVISVKGYRNALFIITVFINTILNIYREIKAKRILDKLRYLAQGKIALYNENKLTYVGKDQLKINDVILLQQGEQVQIDCEILEDYLQVDEAFLTGESELLDKKAGAMVYAGSIIVSGSAKAKVKAINDSKIEKLLAGIKREKQLASPLRESLDKIIKTVTVFIVPLGLLLFLKQYFLTQLSLKDSILLTVASLVGMMPEGLILLSSLALSMGAVRLGYQKVLVQELYSLENLASCDVICLDKTGTLTTDKLEVFRIIQFDKDNIDNIVYALQKGSNNATSNALLAHFKEKDKLVLRDFKPYNSYTKKASGYYLNAYYELGSYEFCDCEKNEEITKLVQRYSTHYRVLCLCENHRIKALILLHYELRKNVKEILNYLERQDIKLYFLSGDSLPTLKAILNNLNLDKHLYDASALDEKALIAKMDSADGFGRLDPAQKKLIIETLQSQGHTVGMIGDGVNDVPALKQADFSISFLSATSSARSIANVVLMDDDFSHLPDIVNEGRRVLNNISKSASLFLFKTCFSFMLSFFTLLFFDAYPYVPIQLTLISSLGIGLPAFVLSLQPNESKVKKGFIKETLNECLPYALSLSLLALILSIFKINNYQTIFVISTFILLLTLVFKLSLPLNTLRIILLTAITIGFIIAISFFTNFFYLDYLNLTMVLISLLCSAICFLLSYGLKRSGYIKKALAFLESKFNF